MSARKGNWVKHMGKDYLKTKKLTRKELEDKVAYWQWAHDKAVERWRKEDVNDAINWRCHKAKLDERAAFFASLWKVLTDIAVVGWYLTAAHALWKAFT